MRESSNTTLSRLVPDIMRIFALSNYFSLLSCFRKVNIIPLISYICTYKTDAMRTSFYGFLIAFCVVSISSCAPQEVPPVADGQGEQPSGTEVPSTPGEDGVIHVSEVIIGPDEDIVLEVGKTAQLTCTVIPEDAADKSISWRSDHPEFVTVSDKGLVTAIAVGKASISAVTNDGGVSGVKLVTVYEQKADSFTSVRITSPQDGDSQFVWGGSYSGNIQYLLEFKQFDDFQIKAQGYPENADDELEFVPGSNSPAFKITSDGHFTSEAGCGMKSTTDYKNHYFFVRSKKNPKASAKVYVRTPGPYVKRFVIEDRPATFPAAFIHPGGDMVRLRYSSYIGKDVVRKFIFNLECVSLNTNITEYRRQKDFTIVSSTGPVTFTKVDKVLEARVNPGAVTSSSTNQVDASVTIRVNNGERTIPFIVCDLDPLYPKIGDGISNQKKGYLDGGYRGRGVFETPAYKEEEMQSSVIIAYVGDNLYEYDKLYKNYCKGGIPGVNDKSYHGIVIPSNVSRLYRKSKPNGEWFSEDLDDLKNSDAWPTSWFFPTWVLYENAYNIRGYAITCAMVYRNGRCGSSHDVLPANFFVTQSVLDPSKTDKDLKVNDFSWESDFYGSFNVGNLKNPKDDPFNAEVAYSDGLNYCSTWIWPSFLDMSFIFGATGLDISKLTDSKGISYRDPVIDERINVFQVCGRRFSGVAKQNYYNKYWLPHCSSAGRYALMMTVEESVVSAKMVVKNQDQAYVLPIAYF